MLGVLVNAVAVIVGGTVGLILKKGIPSRITDTLMKAIGLCVLYIGITGFFGEIPQNVSGGKFTLILIISMIFGTAAGALIKLEDRFKKLTEKLEARLGGKGNDISRGFIAACLMFCIGAMTVVGSLNAGINGDNSILYSKSLLDLISSIILASTLGIGVPLSFIFVLIYQGGIVLLSGVIAPILTDYCIAMISTVGACLIVGLALNVLGITKLKIMDMTPALFLPLVLCLI